MVGLGFQYQRILLAWLAFFSFSLLGSPEVLAEEDEKPTAVLGEIPPPAPLHELWKKVPVYQPMPPAGMTMIFPKGEGYYSLRDVLQDRNRKSRPKYPYPTFSLRAAPFFDADWRYLDNPTAEEHDYCDFFKRIHIHDDWLFTTGGEFRWRFENQVNRFLTNKDDNFNLFRQDVYGDIAYQDWFRFYIEFLDAESIHQNLPPSVFDYSQAEFLDLFVEFKLGERPGGNPVQFRAGRQELLYGSQRLISPLEWANARRTFQGVKLFTQGEKWNFDLFWVQPVVPQLGSANSQDNGQNFTGLWLTHKPKPGTFLDFYALNLDQANRVALGEDRRPGTFNVTTLGSRFYGREQDWLYDVEPILQVGRWSDQTLITGAFTISGGYIFEKLPLKPQLWLAEDFASGTPYPFKGNQFSTFQQLFPFGHYYFGAIDIVGRQNINDLNGQLVVFPCNWISSTLQFHHFNLVCSRDFLYSAGGKPLRRDPSGNAGSDVGNELDFYVNFTLSPHQNILVGYSKLFQGRFLQETGSLQSPEATYMQYGFRW
ncbi:MAG: alginate export family protein [Gemmataceae bacterium]|nr:alginate export family protein [Gemmataceae bacterium]